MNAAHERELQSVACAMFVEELLAGRKLHVILLGDLDDTPGSSSIRFWTGRQALGGVSVAYRDAWEAINPRDQGYTFARDNPLVRAGEMALELGRRIDYVMIRCGIHGPPSTSPTAFDPLPSRSTAFGQATTVASLLIWTYPTTLLARGQHHPLGVQATDRCHDYGQAKTADVFTRPVSPTLSGERSS